VNPAHCTVRRAIDTIAPTAREVDLAGDGQIARIRCNGVVLDVDASTGHAIVWLRGDDPVAEPIAVVAIPFDAREPLSLHGKRTTRSVTIRLAGSVVLTISTRRSRVQGLTSR
jgi:hypothetical protein